ncbi:MAG: sigma-70 family RNA polymerase sigma factor [Planctomycetales bacterium]|nr:sigma-70 family RNA polymerase sigma factor [Planctomycetales bacterium]
MEPSDKSPREPEGPSSGTAASARQPSFGGEGSHLAANATEEFVALLGAHEREVFTYIYSLTGNWSDAQEVMQRVRIRIWQQFNQYDPTKSFGAWARAIAYYLVLAYRKDRQRRRESFSESVMEAVSRTYDEQEPLDDRREVLMHCLSKLRSDHQKLVKNYYARNEPVADMAQEMGLTANALRQALFRIRKALQRCVERSLTANGS